MHLGVPAGNPVPSVDQFCPCQAATRLTAVDPALVKVPTIWRRSADASLEKRLAT
jgi:hypothetical protein